MKLDPDTKQIICYGDSNTWGKDPVGNKRYARAIRWAGVLQAKLGNSYDVVEAGMPGRTIFTLDPSRSPLICAKNNLDITFIANSEADTVIVALGTNDIWQSYTNSAETIVVEYKSLLNRINKLFTHSPQLICVGPVIFDPKFTHEHEKSLKVSELLNEVLPKSIHYVNLANLNLPLGEDGVHFSRKAHLGLGEFIAELLTTKI